MAAASSFDITSPIDFQEVDNALNQARKEVGQRYDFKGAKTEIVLNPTEKTLTLVADDEFKMNALWEIVQIRLVRRGVPIKNFKVGESEAAAGGTVRRVDADSGRHPDRDRAGNREIHQGQEAEEGAGIDSGRPGPRHLARRRTTSRKPFDELREHDFGIALQFGNYR